MSSEADTALALLGAAAPATVASAAARDDASRPATTSNAAKADCFDNWNESGYWYEYNGDETGYAEWYEYDEILRVVDEKGDGWRTDAFVEICYDGQWEGYGWYDSGPNEGSTDSNRYDLNFKEGRRVRFQVCKTRDSVYKTCGATIYVHA